MKKNKTLAYMLAATLLVGGTFVGTKALFTDRATATTDLVITMGEIGIEVKEGAKWKIEKQNGEVVETESGKEFTHLKTGDKLVKEITITNTGNLHRKLTITNEGMAPVLPQGIKFSAKAIEDLNGIVVEPTATITVKLELEVEGNHKHNESNLNKSDEVKIDFKDMKYVINAQQVTQEELKEHSCLLSQN